MSSRAIVASVAFVGALMSISFVTFAHPTWVASEMLTGPYVIVHDEDKMTRGEPCTTFYRVGTRAFPREEVVSFRCIPHEQTVVHRFTTTISSDPVLGIDTLTEYQF